MDEAGTDGRKGTFHTGRTQAHKQAGEAREVQTSVSVFSLPFLSCPRAPS